MPLLARDKTIIARVWTYVRDDRPFGGTSPPAAMFRYSPDRTGEHPQQHLAGYAGILQADAYAGFNALYAPGRKPGSITEAACWAHGWYDLRWKAEVFHKVIKSGCRAEEARLETAERLAKFLALIAVVSWRIFFVTMSARAKPDSAPDSVLTAAEIAALNRIDASRTRPRLKTPRLDAYLLQIAMLGGYLARKNDLPPGNMVVWRGMTRLHDVSAATMPFACWP